MKLYFNQNLIVMRNSTYAKLVVVGTVVLLLGISCTKVDVGDEMGGKPKKKYCDVAAFTLQSSDGGTLNIFNKTYDLSGRRLVRLDAGLYSGGATLEFIQLNLVYDNDRIYFLSTDNTADTGLVVYLNNAGRVTKAEAGAIIDDGFGPQEFFYQDGRLHLINIDNNWLRIWFRYDQWGNNTQIVTDSSADGLPRLIHEYQYDYNRKSSKQLYHDEARGFSFNVFTLLHAAGFFPELNPVHIRTRTTVKWGDYLAYDYKLLNHVFDNDGRLVKYQTQRSGDHSPAAAYHLYWNCAKANSDLVTMAD
jgi:hypothetical protein